MAALDPMALVAPQLLGDALEGSRHAVFVTEERWQRVLAVNAAACELLGYTRAELLELTGADFSALEPETVAHGRDRARATGTLRRKDGSLVRLAYWITRTRVARIDFVLTITAPIDEAEPVHL